MNFEVIIELWIYIQAMQASLLVSRAKYLSIQINCQPFWLTAQTIQASDFVKLFKNDLIFKFSWKKFLFLCAPKNTCGTPISKEQTLRIADIYENAKISKPNNYPAKAWLFKHNLKNLSKYFATLSMSKAC